MTFSSFFKRKAILLALGGFLFFAFGCGSGTSDKKETANNKDSVQSIDSVKQDLDKIKEVFDALPSPVEIADLIKRAGAKYDPKLLNPTANVSKYTTTKSQALNLGVYSADLSFASLYEKKQTTMDYMDVSKKLADNLGMLDAVDKKTFDRIESNISNKDSIMVIISETVTNYSSSLKESGRPEIAAMIFTGGWIEGVYVITQISKNNPKNEKLVERILDQRLSLGVLMELLEKYKKNDDVASIMKDLSQIKAIYDKVKTTSEETKVDTTSQVTSILGKKSATLSKEDLASLMEKISVIRTNIVK